MKAFALASTPSKRVGYLLGSSVTNCFSNIGKSRGSWINCYDPKISKRRFHTSAESLVKIGMFGDIHFQDVGLDRVVETGEWIVEEFEKQKVDYVVCMGDVLNTRETVSVKAQSSAFEFFDKLASKIPKDVHVICGNHDLNLKYDTKISSLDALGLKLTSPSNLFLHKEIEEVDIDGKNCVMIPYYEDSFIIRDWVSSKISKNSESLGQSLAFCHMAINGAIQRYQVDNKNNIYCRTFDEHIGKNIVTEKRKGSDKKKKDSTHDMDLPADNSKVPKYLTQFQRVFSGHFHHHHFCDKKVLYVGSPMQHHFGDSGDAGRGIVIYDTETDEIHFVQNPNWDKFRILRVKYEEDLGDLGQYKGKYISIIYESMDVNPQKIQDKLLEAGAKSVRKQSVVVRKVQSSLQDKEVSKDADEKVGHLNFEDFVVKYVKQYANLSSMGVESKFVEDIIETGKEIISTVTKQGKHHLNIGDTFKANLKSITIQNFLGIQGCITLDIKNMENGVWFLEGANGSGKSTLLEAITWCMFDNFLRSDMSKVDYAVNDVAKKDCLVRIDFDSGYSIERFRKYTKTGASELPDNIAKLSPERKGTGLRVFYQDKYMSEYEKGSLKDSQVALESLLGINYDMFAKSIVVGDNSVNFLTSDSKKRRELIEDLLGLYLFDDYLASTRERKKALVESVFKAKTLEEQMLNSIQLLEENIERNEKEKASIEDLIQRLSEEYLKVVSRSEESSKAKRNLEEQWRKAQQFEIVKQNKASLTVKRNSLEQRVNNNIANISRLNSEATNFHINGKTQISEIEAYFNEKIDQIRNKMKHVSESIMSNNFEIRHAKEKLEKLEKLAVLNECPYCEQKIEHQTHSKFEHEKQTLQEAVTQLTRDQTTHSLSFHNLEEELNELERQKRSTITNLTRVQHSLLLTENETKTLQSDLESVENQLKEIETQSSSLDSSNIEEIQEKLNQVSMMEKSMLEKKYQQEAQLKVQKQKLKDLSEQTMKQKFELDSLRDKHVQSAKESEKFEKEYAVLDFWEKAFDRRARKSSKDDFETMRSFLLDKSIEDLNNILEEYSKLIGSDSLPITFNSDLMINEDYGKRSSGQRKRNHLMIHFALFELVRQRSRFSSNFLMLDEVFDALDVTGQEQAQQVIEMLSTKIDKVFVISHSTQNMEFRKKAIKATMTPNGSKYELIYR
ncbi:hypothetical protein C9374_014510 [Naegleria lovaniensis]|uniref:Rad50/SbcC-type AAA domain-containing protein n=1 Tax=Naegleria lovaniensis TaxID=51637 RepID=A0AA88KMN0_NAELO|nr:uncharacterized protein C9374_014510 [Naegleria lovaniensis]KAG2389110.1 hypothetical protein C9374_014510 [Naegleria lovaniensis]